MSHRRRSPYEEKQLDYAHEARRTARPALPPKHERVHHERAVVRQELAHLPEQIEDGDVLSVELLPGHLPTH